MKPFSITEEDYIELKKLSMTTSIGRLSLLACLFVTTMSLVVTFQNSVNIVGFHFVFVCTSSLFMLKAHLERAKYLNNWGMRHHRQKFPPIRSCPLCNIVCLCMHTSVRFQKGL